MLTVIVIIGILASLATVAAYQVLGTAKAAVIKTDINSIERAVMAYEEKYGEYPPSYLDLNTAVGQNIVRRHLAKAFPRCNPTTEMGFIPRADGSFNNTEDRMTEAQALVFWLTSISSDPARPLSAPTEDRQSLLDFDKSRLTAVDNTVPPGWRLEGTVPRYNPLTYSPSSTPGVPYVYFEARSYIFHCNKPFIAGNGSMYCVPHLWLDAYDVNQDDQLQLSELDKNGDGNVTEAEFRNACVNPKSFQIISAGLDGDYGGDATTTPIDYGGSTLQVHLKSYPDGLGYTEGDNDNVTNFTKRDTLENDKEE